MRILFCSTAGAGHVGPLLPLARALARDGHGVLFVLPPSAGHLAERAGFDVEIASAPDPEADDRIQDAIKKDPTEATVLINREYFGRMCTAAMLPTVSAVCERWRPGLVVHEAAEYASALAAHRAGIKHLQVAIGLASVEWSALHDLAGAALIDFGADAVDVLSSSPYLTRLPEGLDPTVYPRTIRYRDPAMSQGSADEHAEPEIADLTAGGNKVVYATLGSMAGRSPWSPGAYRVLLDAFEMLARSNPEIRVLLTVGNSVDPDDLGAIPANTLVRQWVPFRQALAAATAVLSHGGSGTAYGTLGAGLPSVFFPLFADQPYNAKLMADSGAGIQIDTEDLRTHGMPMPSEPADRARLAALAEEVAQAVAAVLGESEYAAKARELGAQLAALPSLSEALAEFKHE